MSNANHSQALRLQIAHIKFATYLADKADFMAFNSHKFTPQFELDVQAAIDEVCDILPDHIWVYQNAGLCEAVAKVKTRIRDYHARLKYFAEEAFPRNTVMQKTLGLGDYNAAMRSVGKLGVWLEFTKTQVHLYENNLMAAGMSIAWINEIDTLTADYEAAYTAQIAGQYARGIEAAHRNKAYATLEGLIKAICKAGKLIYKDNPAKYKAYLICQSAATSASPQVEEQPDVVTATLIDKASKPILTPLVLDDEAPIPSVPSVVFMQLGEERYLSW